MGSVTAFQLYVLNASVVPSIEALRPVNAQKVQEAIALQLPATENGLAAAKLAQSQVEESRLFYESWQRQAQSQAQAIRSSLIGWVVVIAISLVGIGQRLLGRANAA